MHPDPEAPLCGFARQTVEAVKQRYRERRGGTVSEEELSEYLIEWALAQRQLEILAQSWKILCNTTVPDTFFMRYSLARRCAEEILRLERLDEDLLRQAAEIRGKLDQYREILINDFIDRTQAAGKRDLLKRTMWRFLPQMPPESVLYFESKLGKLEQPANQESAYEN